jgi:hypothetical protein
MSAIVEFARQELGLTLHPRQAQAMSEFEERGHQQAVWPWGRRGGKSISADVLALYDAVMRDRLRERMLPGETRTVGIVCPRLDQAAAHIRRMAGWIERSPRLSRMLAAEPTTDTISFLNGSEVVAYPCSARGIRGGAWSCAILDELGHFISSDSGNAAGDIVLEAVQPSLAQFGRDGWLIVISTPRWRQGAFWTMVQRAMSGRFEYVHYQHLTTAEANPGIDPEWLEDRRREDPDVYAREYLAEWISAGAYLDGGEVVRAVRREPRILPPVGGVRYEGALDPAYSLDRFAMAIGHRARDGRVIVDGCWAWHRPGHDEVMDTVAELAKAYGVRRLRTDQASPVPIREALKQRGVSVEYAPWTNESKASAFARLKVALNTGALELPDDRELVEELCNLEARPTPAGYTRIAAAGQGHDDRAIVVASLAATLAPPRRGALDYARAELARHQGRPARTVPTDTTSGSEERPAPVMKAEAAVPREDDRPELRKSGTCAHPRLMNAGSGWRCVECGSAVEAMPAVDGLSYAGSAAEALGIGHALRREAGRR